MVMRCLECDGDLATAGRFCPTCGEPVPLTTPAGTTWAVPDAGTGYQQPTDATWQYQPPLPAQTWMYGQAQAQPGAWAAPPEQAGAWGTGPSPAADWSNGQPQRWPPAGSYPPPAVQPNGSYSSMPPQPMYPPAPAWGPPPVMRVCYACGQAFGPDRSCRFCRQVDGLPVGMKVSSAGKRFLGYMLESVLFLLTLGIGWLVWACIVYADGKSPAKQLLGMRVIHLQSRRPANWGQMALRFLCKIGIWLAASLTFPLGLVASIWLLWDKDTQELWDKIVGTVVIDD